MSTETAAGIDVGKIEHDLRQLWIDMAAAKEGASDSPGVLRACVQNLIVYAPGEELGSALAGVLAEISAQHPSRIFLILPRGEDQETQATVSAVCHVTAGRKQVCCEQIAIEAGPGELARISSVIEPLLVSDLPVVLWWRSDIPFGDREFGRLIRRADRVILDSSKLPAEEGSFGQLVGLVEAVQRWTAFTDLSWSALTPWRQLLSGFFDVPMFRPRMELLDEVKLEVSAPAGAPMPVEAKLVAGWLATRLGWKRQSDMVRDGNVVRLELAGRTHPVRMQIELKPDGVEGKARLTAVRLLASTDPGSEFAVTRSAGGKHLVTSATLGGSKQCGTVAQFDGLDEGRMVGRELEILEHDLVYETTLQFFRT